MDCFQTQFPKRGLILLLALFAACKKEPALEDYGVVPDFELTNEQGQPFKSSQLIGTPWIADFIYTTCPGPCPRMSSIMTRLQTESVGFRMVSFTIDPARDTPEVMAAYGKRFNADPNRWTFLTGPRETLQMLNRKGFKLGDVDGSMDHSTRFVLVDRNMHIRGFLWDIGGGRDPPVETRLGQNFEGGALNGGIECDFERDVSGTFIAGLLRGPAERY